MSIGAGGPAPARRPARWWIRSLTVLAAVSLATLAGGASAALAAPQVRLVSPTPGGAVEGPVQVEVAVQAGPGEAVTQVEARLVLASAPSGAVHRLDFAGGQQEGGESRWVTALDPLASWASGDGRAMRNGVWTVQARTVGQRGPGPWSTDAVRFVVPPPVPQVSTLASDEGTSVTVQWSRPPVPDFVSTTVERRPAGGGAFAAVATRTEPSAVSAVDADAPAGPLEYRVVTARQDGDGGQLTTSSAASPVTARPTPPPSPPAASPAETTPAPAAPAGAGGGGAGAPPAAPPGDGPLDTTTFRRTLPLPSGAPAPPAVDAADAVGSPATGAAGTPSAGEDELLADAEGARPGASRGVPGSGELRVGDAGASTTGGVLRQVAAGLLCLLVGAHVLRFRAAGARGARTSRRHAR